MDYLVRFCSLVIQNRSCDTIRLANINYYFDITEYKIRLNEDDRPMELKKSVLGIYLHCKVISGLYGSGRPYMA